MPRMSRASMHTRGVTHWAWPSAFSAPVETEGASPLLAANFEARRGPRAACYLLPRRAWPAGVDADRPFGRISECLRRIETPPSSVEFCSARMEASAGDRAQA